MAKTWIVPFFAILFGVSACAVETEQQPQPEPESIGKHEEALMGRKCSVINRGGNVCDIVCCTMTCRNTFECSMSCSTTENAGCGPIIYDPGSSR